MLVHTCEADSPVHLPDFFIVGAAKSGTTSAHYYLDQHPEVCMPAQKEPRYFSFAEAPPDFAGPTNLDNSVTRLQDYLKLFECPETARCRGDASPTYLYLHEESIRNMERVYGSDNLSKVRIVILLRQPVDRAWSQYWTFQRIFQETLPYEEAIQPEMIEQRMSQNWNIFYDYIGFGKYASQVQAYIDRFGKENVRVYLFDDLIGNPLQFCSSLFGFIGVDPSFVPGDLKAFNVSGRAKNEKLVKFLLSESGLKTLFKKFVGKKDRDRIRNYLSHLLFRKVEQSRDLRQTLMKYYSDDIDALSDIIKRDLTHWKKA